MSARTSRCYGAPYAATGYQMIRSLSVENYRCYERLRVEGCTRLNLIVGDNGTGKTSLLEAMFLALATSSEVAFRFRQQRGLDGFFGSTTRRIEDAIWGDFFHNYDTKKVISVATEGDGDETRSVRMAKGASEVRLPLSDDGSESLTLPMAFTWTNAQNQSNTLVPKIDKSGFHFPETGEDMANFFFHQANTTTGSAEVAGRFSDLSRRNRHQNFVEVFCEEFGWVRDLRIEVSAGAPVVYATLADSGVAIPLTNISGGINHMVSIMLSVAHREKAVVLVDEIENGIYYKHHRYFWRALLKMLKENDSQLFVSTHSLECMNALLEVAQDDLSSISVWRARRQGALHDVQIIKGDDISLFREFDEEIR